MASHLSFEYNREYEQRVHQKVSVVLRDGLFCSLFRLACNTSCVVMEKLRGSSGDERKRVPKRVRLDFSDFKEMSGDPHNSSKIDGRICTILASYSSDGKIPDRVVYALKEYSRITDFLMVVGDYSVEDSELSKIRKIVNCAYYVRHNQYDFGSWSRGLEYLRYKKLKFDYLVLVNDSNYGPINQLDKIYEIMSSKRSDFWSINDNYEPVFHHQSYFYMFSKKVFCSKSFINLFFNLPPFLSFEQAVNDYEMKLTGQLSKEFSHSVLISGFSDNMRGILAGNGNATVWPVSLLEAGSPYVKVKCINGSLKMDLHESEIDTIEYLRTHNEEMARIVEADSEVDYSSYDVSNYGCFPKSIKPFLRDVNIVSFDIFDTLLIRPFRQPVDLFLYIEKKYKVPGFKERRMRCEEYARSHARNSEVTINQIYNEMGKNWAFLKNIELLTEKELIRPNPVVKQYYEEAKKLGRRIICVTDTYFSNDYLSELLKGNGYDDIEMVFISSEYGKSKGTGLYEEVINACEIEANKVLHIGDNKEADYEIPKRYGLKTIHIPKLTSLFDEMPSNAKYLFFFGSNYSLATTAYAAQLSKYRSIVSTTGSAYTDLGYCLGGPLALSYVNVIYHSVINYNLDGLFFVARDGFILKKIYDKYYVQKRPINTEYVYLTRHTCINSLLSYQNSPEYLKQLLIDASVQYPAIGVSNDYRENIETFERFKDKLMDWSKEYRGNLEEHISGCARNCKRIGVVDMTTGRNTAFNCAKQLLGDRIVINIVNGRFNNNLNVPCVSNVQRLLKHSDDITLMLSEQMITSVEPPIIAVGSDLLPIYGDDDEDVEIKKEILRGVEEYVNDYVDVFGLDDNCMMAGEEWLNLAMSYVKYCNNADLHFMERVSHATDMGHLNRVSLKELILEARRNY